jgi:predicted nucleotidyltransferase
MGCVGSRKGCVQVGGAPCWSEGVACRFEGVVPMERAILRHHQETIDRVAEVMSREDNIRALVVGGSVAHGFATETSDVDVFLVICEEEYSERLNRKQLTYYNRELSTYEGGYVDGKYITVDFLRRVAEKGSEPARFAFKDAFVVFSRIKGLDELLLEASRYPVDRKHDKIQKFAAQFEAWKWFIGEAKKLRDAYLLSQAVSNYTLFAGRLILAHNEELYPYHKWFLRVLAGVANKPPGLVEQIELVLTRREDDDVERLYKSITEFTDWGFNKRDWANRFLVDCELAWMSGSTALADL